MFCYNTWLILYLYIYFDSKLQSFEQRLLIQQTHLILLNYEDVKILFLLCNVQLITAYFRFLKFRFCMKKANFKNEWLKLQFLPSFFHVNINIPPLCVFVFEPKSSVVLQNFPVCFSLPELSELERMSGFLQL